MWRSLATVSGRDVLTNSRKMIDELEKLAWDMPTSEPAEEWKARAISLLGTIKEEVTLTSYKNGEQGYVSRKVKRVLEYKQTRYCAPAVVS
jgi:hypothetical protein